MPKEASSPYSDNRAVQLESADAKPSTSLSNALAGATNAAIGAAVTGSLAGPEGAAIGLAIGLLLAGAMLAAQWHRDGRWS